MKAGCCHSVSTAESIGGAATGHSPVRISNDRSTTWTGSSAGAAGAKVGKGRSRCGRTGALDPLPTVTDSCLNDRSSLGGSTAQRAPVATKSRNCRSKARDCCQRLEPGAQQQIDAFGLSSSSPDVPWRFVLPEIKQDRAYEPGRSEWQGAPT